MENQGLSQQHEGREPCRLGDSSAAPPEDLHQLLAQLTSGLGAPALSLGGWGSPPGMCSAKYHHSGHGALRPMKSMASR